MALTREQPIPVHLPSLRRFSSHGSARKKIRRKKKRICPPKVHLRKNKQLLAVVLGHMVKAPQSTTTPLTVMQTERSIVL